MEFSGFNDQPETIKTFEEDMKYVNSKLKMIDSKLSSIHSTNNEYVSKLKDTSNINCLNHLKDQETEKKIEDPPNSTTKTTYSDTSQKTNLPGVISEVTTVPDPNDTFSKLKEYQFDANNLVNMNNEIIKNDFVNASTLINNAKKKAKETDLYLRKLHEKILPRCQSAYITSDIVKRNIYADIPSKITQRIQPGLEEKLGKSMHANTENSKTFSKPRPSTQEKRVHLNNPSGDFCKTNNPDQLNITSKSIQLISKDNCRNDSIRYVNFEDNISDGKYADDCKVNKLTVQRIPGVNLKPDLVTQKLVNIQIKPDNKKLLRNYKPNVAYQEFAFGLEPETCKCHSVIQPKMVARHEIRKIICEMLDNTSSNYLLNDRIIRRLQKIITKLEDTKFSDYNESSEVEDLIEEHSMVGYNKEVIKKRLLEIADNLVENESDGISFDQISVEIENNSHQVLKRLTKIKNSILGLNPLVEFPNLPTDSKLDDAPKYVNENPTNHPPSNNLFSKNLQETPSTQYVSVKDFLRHGCNFTNFKMFENASVIKECDSQITLCSNDSINQNQNIFNTQNALNNHNNISQQKKHQLKFQDQSSLFEDSVSYQPRSSHSSIILKHQLKPSDEENRNNDKNDDYTTLTNGYDCETENNLKTDKVQFLDKSTESSTTSAKTTSSMVIINYNCLCLRFIQLYYKTRQK